MSTKQQHAEDFGITEKIGEIKEALSFKDPSDRPSEAAIQLAAKNEVAYEEETPTLLGNSEGITELTETGLKRRSQRAHQTVDDFPTKQRMAAVTKIMLPANCRGGMDGNVHADFCPNMSFCGKCLDLSKIKSSDVVHELAPIEVLDLPAYVEKLRLSTSEKEEIYLSALPTDLRKNTRFLPKTEAVQFAAAYAAMM